MYKYNLILSFFSKCCRQWGSTERWPMAWCIDSDRRSRETNDGNYLARVRLNNSNKNIYGDKPWYKCILDRRKTELRILSNICDRNSYSLWIIYRFAHPDFKIYFSKMVIINTAWKESAKSLIIPSKDFITEKVTIPSFYQVDGFFFITINSTL